jgi:hypothetical protein
MAEENENKPSTKIPSELILSDRWDKCLERFLVKTSVGLVVGIMAGTVIARKWF